MKTNYRMQLMHAQRTGASWSLVARLAFLEAYQNWKLSHTLLALRNRHGGNKSQAMKQINKYSAIMRQRKAILDRINQG